MKVVFLDLDGVLNVIPQGHDKHGGIFHPEFVTNLQRLVTETSAKIVISSSWRSAGLEAMKEMWVDRALPCEVIAITGRRDDLDCFSYGRGTEIKEYLEKHPEITNFVILDDDGDMLPEQWTNFVMTSGNDHHPDCIDIGYGLTKICTQKAINILNQGIVERTNDKECVVEIPMKWRMTKDENVYDHYNQWNVWADDALHENHMKFWHHLFTVQLSRTYAHKWVQDYDKDDNEIGTGYNRSEYDHAAIRDIIVKAPEMLQLLRDYKKYTPEEFGEKIDMVIGSLAITHIEPVD